MYINIDAYWVSGMLVSLTLCIILDGQYLFQGGGGQTKNTPTTYGENGFYVERKDLEKCAKNLIGYSRLALNNHESNIDFQIFGYFRQ